MTLWLAVIPMVVLSMVGLAGGNLLARHSPSGRLVSSGTTSTTSVAPSTTSAAPTTTTSVAPSTTSTTQPAPRPALARVTSSNASPAAWGCAAAEEWISAHAAPGFRIFCPGNAMGHEAMTCVNVSGLCPDQRIIILADPCPAAYMNEAHNSWILTGLERGRLDPYGSCG